MWRAGTRETIAGSHANGEVMTEDVGTQLLTALSAAVAAYVMVVAGIGKKQLEWRPRRPRCRWCHRRNCRCAPR